MVEITLLGLPHGNKQEVQSDELGNSIQAMQVYFTKKAALETEQSKIFKEFQGERAQKERDRLNGELNSLRAGILSTINEQFNSIRAMVSERRAEVAAYSEKLRPDLVNADFAFLNAPVTLTNPELQQIADRNSKNALLTRACEEYAEKHNLKIVTESMRLEALSQAAEYAESYLAGCVRHKNDFQLSMFIKQHMSEVDEALSGEVITVQRWFDAQSTAEDVKLLDGDFPLDADELNALLEKHRFNPVMIRAIQDCADKRKITLEPEPEAETAVIQPPDYQAQYTAAKVAGDQLRAIRIKREAHENGVMVN